MVHGLLRSIWLHESREENVGDNFSRASECKKGVLKYLLCLKDHNGSAEPCRHLAKDYLECRMNRNLMAKEEWSKLGFEEKPKATSN